MVTDIIRTISLTFTTQEWREIREDTKPKVMLVAKNGREEESWPSVPVDDPREPIE